MVVVVVVVYLVVFTQKLKSRTNSIAWFWIDFDIHEKQETSKVNNKSDQLQIQIKREGKRASEERDSSEREKNSSQETANVFKEAMSDRIENLKRVLNQQIDHSIKY